jgi:hypothetical protein
MGNARGTKFKNPASPLEAETRGSLVRVKIKFNLVAKLPPSGLVRK